jgi:iron complex outermembrane receptor protein
MPKNIVLIYLTLILSMDIFAQIPDSVYSLEQEIVVTASRVPQLYSELSRSIVIIDQEQIKNAPAHTIDELLNYAAGIDVQSRGAAGIQADLNLRGSNFEQCAVLIDGVKVNDSQTGHHHMNIALSVYDIERIEILKGHGAGSFGSNAFGGVINFITKKRGKSNFQVSAEGGSYNSYNASAHLTLPFENSFHSFTIQKNASDGYDDNLDYNKEMIALKSKLSNVFFSPSLYAGYIKKKFGAQGFYTPKNKFEPRETTETFFSYLNFELKGEAFQFKPSLFIRKHKDDFILFKSQPEVYHNTHNTTQYGVDLQSFYESKLGGGAFGTIFKRDEISSNNLGRHTRNYFSFNLEHRFHFYRHFFLSLSGSLNKYEKWGWQAWPQMDLTYLANANHKFSLSYGQAYRIPSFTELYYSDERTTIGNENLKPEKNVSFEANYTLALDMMNFEFSLFRRNNHNLIDWVLNPTDTIYYAANFTQSFVTGIEFGFQARFNNHFFKKMRLDYTYLNTKLDTKGKLTRYALTHPKRQVTFSLNHSLWMKNLSQSWLLIYKNRDHLANYSQLDTQIKLDMEKWSAQLRVNNLLNENFQSIPGLYAPGRWVWLGVTFKVLHWLQ